MNEENVMTTNEQEERMPFFRIPKAILTDEKYASLSEGAMLLYGILLDRNPYQKEMTGEIKGGRFLSIVLWKQFRRRLGAHIKKRPSCLQNWKGQVL